jgi:hypothetical protein
VEYGTAQPAGAEAKGTMRDDCISGREGKVFELLEGGTATAKRRKEKDQCLCALEGVDRFAENVDRLSIVLQRAKARRRVDGFRQIVDKFSMIQETGGLIW